MSARDHWLDRLDELHRVQDPTPESRQQAETEILQDLALHPPSQTSLHPSVPSLREPKFTPLFQDALDRLTSSEGDTSVLRGIDTSRYSNLGMESEDSDQQKDDLKRVYVALAYTKIRKENLDIMTLQGKNQWLLSNDEIEQELKELEMDLVAEQNEAALIARKAKGL
ncbi:Pre-mRNA-splicing factor SPF27 [Kockiozyma suomiensis]|uniref:Pre-mRNA-splicing factor SPF27 n=1 Tax=Kockiozyma suomiensis TaxID=1337062 RepID=UPI003344141D